jgi:ABC-type Fe3+ transport system permease subunit
LVLALVVVAWPIVLSLAEGLAAGLREGAPFVPDVWLLIRTIGWAAAIGALATLLALPPAWALRAGRWWMLAVVLAALLMPPYLAYAGWGMVRAPGTLVGDWLARQGLAGRSWLPIGAGRVLAVLGLSLWAMPMATLALLSRVRGIDQAILDAARLDPITPIRRAWLTTRLCLPGLLAAWGLVSLIGLGSAIPLHLAQIETWALVVWRAMDESGAAGRSWAWAGAWPVLVLGLAGAVLIGRALSRPPVESAASLPAPGSRPAMMMAIGVLVLAVGAPLAIWGLSLRRAESLLRFWTLNRDDVLASAQVSALVGVSGMLVMLLSWAGHGAACGRTRSVAALTLVVWLIGALVPGVLAGSAVNRAWSWCGPVAEGSMILVLAHLARFGALAAAAGAWMARSEPRDLRDLRRLDDAEGLARWWRAAVRERIVVIPALGVATGLLSLHEIEASIFVQPPGVGSLARTILDLLHFNRSEELSAAGVWLVGGGLLIALASAIVGARHFVNMRPGPRNQPPHPPV